MDIRDTENAMLMAQARYHTWETKFYEEYFMPKMRDELRDVLMGLTPEQHMQLKGMMRPETYEELLKTAGG